MLRSAAQDLRARVLVAALIAFGACATPTPDPFHFDVIFDQREDFSRYRTWDWLPEDAPNGVGRRALHEDSHPLLVRLDQLLREELSARGYRRERENPDFYVTYRLLLGSRAVRILHHGAQRTLSSRSNQGIFDIEAPELKERVYVTGQLHIGMADVASQRVTWMGTLRRSVELDFSPYLADAVRHVLDHFPPPARTLEARLPVATPSLEPAPGLAREGASAGSSGTLRVLPSAEPIPCRNRPGARRCDFDDPARPS